MTLTQKEVMLLEDAKKQEQLCIDKYNKHADCAAGQKLKTLFQALASNEGEHLNTINQLLGGSVPQVPSNSSSRSKFDQSGFQGDCPDNQKQQTQYMCSDALAMEKHASSVYNTSIFEMCQPAVRDVLNHIQKEEQEHGEVIYKYMSDNGLY